MCTGIMTLLFLLSQRAEKLTIIQFTEPSIIIQHNDTKVITVWEHNTDYDLYCIVENQES